MPEIINTPYGPPKWAKNRLSIFRNCQEILEIILQEMQYSVDCTKYFAVGGSDLLKIVVIWGS